jgi:YbgC/YbaW family acyl-CoA thioester hydrolase
MPFVYARTVRFAEVDAAQVMYFSRAYEMAHEAFEELMVAAGFGQHESFKDAKWGMPLVHSEADYKRPWRLGERIHIHAEVVEAGEKSILFEYRFVDEAGQQRTRVGMRHAFVSLETFRARPAPEGIVDALKTQVS